MIKPARASTAPIKTWHHQVMVPMYSSSQTEYNTARATTARIKTWLSTKQLSVMLMIILSELTLISATDILSGLTTPNDAETDYEFKKGDLALCVPHKSQSSPKIKRRKSHEKIGEAYVVLIRSNIKAKEHGRTKKYYDFSPIVVKNNEYTVDKYKYTVKSKTFSKLSSTQYEKRSNSLYIVHDHNRVVRRCNAPTKRNCRPSFDPIAECVDEQITDAGCNAPTYKNCRSFDVPLDAIDDRAEPTELEDESRKNKWVKNFKNTLLRMKKRGRNSQAILDTYKRLHKNLKNKFSTSDVPEFREWAYAELFNECQQDTTLPQIPEPGKVQGSETPQTAVSGSSSESEDMAGDYRRYMSGPPTPRAPEGEVLDGWGFDNY